MDTVPRLDLPLRLDSTRLRPHPASECPRSLNSSNTQRLVWVIPIAISSSSSDPRKLRSNTLSRKFPSSCCQEESHLFLFPFFFSPPPQQQMQMQYGQQRPQTKVTTVHHYHQSAPQYPVVAPTCK